MIKPFLCLITVTLILSSPFAVQRSFAGSIQQISDSPCDKRAPLINNNETIVFVGFCNENDDVFIFKNKKVSQLTHSRENEQATSINNGEIVVWGGGDMSSRKVFLYADGNIRIISDNEKGAYAADLNDRGLAVWHATVEEMDNKEKVVLKNKLFLFDGKSVRELQKITHSARSPVINNEGEIAYSGWVDKVDPTTGKMAYGYSGSFEIFLLHKNGIKQITDSKPYLDNQSPDINDDGFIVWSGQAETNSTEIYLYDGIKTKRLTNNRYADLSPKINNKGEVVWYGWDGSDFELFFYDGKSVKQLTDNDFDDIEPSINDKGDIVWASRNGEYLQVLKSRFNR